MIDNVTFGGFVRTLRKEKQMTQLELLFLSGYVKG